MAILKWADRRAEVVIANPAGIAVNGGGFINASRATLTTGQPQYQAGGINRLSGSFGSYCDHGTRFGCT
ncbi:two-partner secretion domain-containing protein [Salmonella enterica]|uniref:two-partner secretion domain-containing protein n=1 Tax=Salmonella enterica TaxID=28901 RepID=UPI0035BBBCEA